ncbi:lysosomal thioesterase PPT2 homolog [Condylostylus longicornis]|uniref:lysosomal thioesterase PPT2 homolog n=1 Tax=Condylostylus longicornis TaxID=2530218 RepID=UPI00244E1F5E|nr:lysosomal thioesterase PPT2 homolog [Condylostylus longicornis]
MASYTTFSILLLLIGLTSCYKPVILFHGILSGSENMVLLEETIKLFHPGTKVYNCGKFPYWNSLESSWRQVRELKKYLEEINALHHEGVHFIGYSQGGLLGRAAIQSYPQHNIKNFISLSSPQAGQYGDSFLRLIFPNLVAKEAFELFYSRIGQHTSIGGYWNDPFNQELYFKFSKFLPYINNEIFSLNSTNFKNGISKLNKMILIGGPNDGVITPWESSHFGFYNKSLSVVPLYERDIYINDEIGLKTLDKAGKLILIAKSHVNHLCWHTNPWIIREVILPHLD